MAEKAPERRLVAILAADVVGYSRLMAADEAGTLARLKTLRKDLVEPLTTEHRGRTVKLMGDGALMEFGSVLDAVAFAVAVQRAMAAGNADLPAAERIAFRVGVNSGDIIVDGDDIYGDGVNIAARLQTLAEPGGICVSGKVRDEVGRRLDLRFADLGEQRVKNSPDPVRVARVLLEAGPTDTGSEPHRASKRRRLAFGAAALALLAGLAWSWRIVVTTPDGAAPSRVDDRPSLAVLPFAGPPDEAGQAYFAEGIADDLTTDLSKIGGLFVVSRNSAFAFKDQNVPIPEVAERLGVRYVLEGSVRRSGDAVRINAQLIDATTGGHLWAERYDGSLADVFALQDRVTKSIVEALAVTLTPAEASRIGQVGTASPAAYDAYLLGLSHWYRHTPQSHVEALEHFERAIGYDPDFLEARAAAAKAYVFAFTQERSYATAFGQHRLALYRRALAHLGAVWDQPNADVHVMRSWLAFRRHQLDLAIAEAERALELSPNDADALEALAEALIYAGRPEEGAAIAGRALRQSPVQPGRPLSLKGTAAYVAGDPRAAIELLERAKLFVPELAGFGAVLAAAHAELGNAAAAKAAFDLFARGWGQPTLDDGVWWHPFEDREVVDRFAAGLKAAGAPVNLWEFLPVHRDNRFDGEEMRALLFGHTIEGIHLAEVFPWRQRRTADGAVEDLGRYRAIWFPTPSGGFGRIEGDRLCEIWPDVSQVVPFCFSVHRLPDGPWSSIGNYAMVNDIGPHLFKVVE